MMWAIGISPARPSSTVPFSPAPGGGGVTRRPAPGPWARLRGGPKASARGFTLVEVCIAVAIMAMVSAVMIPALGGVSRTELRRSARKVGATVRQSFNDAALNGRTARMVFTLGEQNPNQAAIMVEATDEILAFEGDNGALEVASDPNETNPPLSGPFGEPISMAEDTSQATTAQQTVGALLGVSKLGARAARPTFTPLGDVSLPNGVHVSDILVEGMLQPVTKGIVRLTFFANGYTQAAVIHIEDNEKNMFTVQVEALTGRAIVTEGYLEELL